MGACSSTEVRELSQSELEQRATERSSEIAEIVSETGLGQVSVDAEALAASLSAYFPSLQDEPNDTGVLSGFQGCPAVSDDLLAAVADLVGLQPGDLTLSGNVVITSSDLGQESRCVARTLDDTAVADFQQTVDSTNLVGLANWQGPNQRSAADEADGESWALAGIDPATVLLFERDRTRGVAQVTDRTYVAISITPVEGDPPVAQRALAELLPAHIEHLETLG